MSMDINPKLVKLKQEPVLLNQVKLEPLESEETAPTVSSQEPLPANEVLNWMAATSNVQIPPTSTDTAGVTKKTPPTREEIVAEEAKKLAEDPELDISATGSTTLSYEKQCTKGRHLNGKAKEMAVSYLDKEIKNRLKEEFLTKYSYVLSEIGYSKDKIATLFEDMYAKSKTAVADRVSALDANIVTYGNKGFLKNKGWIKVDTGKLVDAFMQKFNEQAANLANVASAKADEILLDSKVNNNTDNDTDLDKMIESFKKGSINADEFTKELEILGAKNISIGLFGNFVKFELGGQSYSVQKDMAISNLNSQGALTGDWDEIRNSEYSDFEFESMERYENHLKKVGFKPGDVIDICVVTNGVKTKIRKFVKSDGTIVDLGVVSSNNGPGQYANMILDSVDEFRKFWEAGVIQKNDNIFIKFEDQYLQVIINQNSEGISQPYVFVGTKDGIVYYFN